MNTAYNWPAPEPTKASPARIDWGKYLLRFAVLFLAGVFVVNATQGGDTGKGSGGNFYAAPGWTINRAADLSVKIEYDGGASRARADCAMKTIVGHVSWLEWQAMGSDQATAISVAEEGC